MNILTPQILADLWRSYGEGQTPSDPDLAAFQKFMVLHEDMHEYWEGLLTDPTTPLEVEEENLLVHIAMDAATERALIEDQPPGLRALFSGLVQKGMPEWTAFHVLSQAMQYEFLTAVGAGHEMDLAAFLSRAEAYCQQAAEQFGAP